MSADEPLLPAAGAPVTLVIDDGRVRARVVSDDDPSTLELSALVVPEALQRAGRTDGRVEFITDRGPCRLQGTAALSRRSESEDIEGLIVRFTHGPSGQLLLRSERLRAPFEVAIGVEIGRHARNTRTLDLRRGGALLRGPLTAEVGDAVRYFIEIPGRRDPIEGDARVTRVTENGDVAIHFGAMDDDEREDLALAIFEALRSGGS